MKNIILSSALGAVLLFSSCVKDKLNTEYPIVGLWVGTYDITAGYESGGGLYYSFSIMADSTLLIHSQGADGNTYYGVGRWTLEQDVFKSRITATNLSQTGAVQDITAIYSKRNGTLRSGTVQNVGQGVFAATFSLDRRN